MTDAIEAAFPNPEEIGFERAFAELETIVVRFEKGELNLDESLALFERGNALASFCSRKLAEAEAKMAQLVAASASQENSTMQNPAE